MLTLSDFVLIYLIVIVGAIIQGSIGMGFSLIVAPIFIHFTSDFVPVPIILCGLFLSIFVVIRDHKAIDYLGIKIALVGNVLGAIIAAILLIFISAILFKIIFAIIIILAVIVTILKIKINIDPKSLIIAGFFSGLMGTIASIGGPPMAILYQYEKSDRIRSSLSGFFLIASIISLISLIIVGKFTLNELFLFFKIAPAVIIGFLFSSLTIKKLKTGFTRTIILCVTSLSAIMIIIKIINTIEF